MNSLFLQFSGIFSIAVILGLLMRFFRQPSFLGYVIVGSVVALFAGSKLPTEFLSILSSIGIMLLLFLVGLEMDVKVLKELSGKLAVISVFQILITTALFTLVFNNFGFGLYASFLLAVAFSFSSTIIVVKLLSEKKETESLFGKIGVGVLLVQDLVAVGLLLLVGDNSHDGVQHLVIKAGIILVIAVFISSKVMPQILSRLAKSTDELILFSLAWCFIVASFVSLPFIGLSIEVGGFLAGLALSGSLEKNHIVTKVKPLRDFFLTLFFVSLGLAIKFDAKAVFSVMVLSLGIITLKPLIVWIVMRITGYRQKVSFMTAILFGQASEFSLILVNQMVGKKILGEGDLALISMSLIVSMVVSAYLISNKDRIYKLFRPVLNLAINDRGQSEPEEEPLSGHIILFGCHRMGRSILKQLEKLRDEILIVDHDPEIVAKLLTEGRKVIYGDISDTEIYDRLGMSKAKMVISTVRDVNESKELLLEIKKRKWLVPVVVDAESHEEAKDLYRYGAAYAVFPHYVSGLHLGELLNHGITSKEALDDYRIAQEKAESGVYE